MEITIISAQGLKNTCSGLFARRLRPFIAITTYPPSSCSREDNCKLINRTKVDEQGGVNPTWGDKFHVSLDTSFFANRYSCIFLQLYTRRLIAGRAQLGWCQIPVTDIGFPPAGSVRYLSYRIRERDGTRGHGIVNLAIKLTGHEKVAEQGRLLDPIQKDSEPGQTVLGIPVAMFCQMRICQ